MVGVSCLLATFSILIPDMFWPGVDNLVSTCLYCDVVLPLFLRHVREGESKKINDPSVGDCIYRLPG